MENINKEYKLTEKSFNKKKYKKTQIVIGNTLDKAMGHFSKWEKQINGTFKKSATYTITLDGKIHEHFNPIYYSNFLNDEELDKKLISIVLENEGWVIKDFENNKLINWSGDFYERDDKIIKKTWKGKINWVPYSNEQMDSLVKLCDDLIKKFKINRFVSPDNIKIRDFNKKKGIYYRSNFNKNAMDISPAFNIDEFKKRIEKNE